MTPAELKNTRQESLVRADVELLPPQSGGAFFMALLSLFTKPAILFIEE